MVVVFQQVRRSDGRLVSSGARSAARSGPTRPQFAKDAVNVEFHRSRGQPSSRAIALFDRPPVTRCAIPCSHCRTRQGVSLQVFVLHVGSRAYSVQKWIAPTKWLFKSTLPPARQSMNRIPTALRHSPCLVTHPRDWMCQRATSSALAAGMADTLSLETLSTALADPTQKWAPSIVAVHSPTRCRAALLSAAKPYCHSR